MRKHNLKLVSDAQALAEETKKIKIKKGLILKKRADGRSPFWFAQITVSGNQPKLITTGKTDEREATEIAYQLQAKLMAESNAGLSIHSKSFERVAKDVAAATIVVITKGTVPMHVCVPCHLVHATLKIR